MINDGFTQEYRGCVFRPLTTSDKETLERLHERDDWVGIDELLWSRPRFYSTTEFPTSETKTEIAKRMLAYDDGPDIANLKKSLEIALTHPLLSLRSCDMCRKWWFDEDTGYVCQNAGGPVKRPSYSILACDTNTGCPKGHHSHPIEMNERNQQAWKHFLEWRHVGLPDLHKQCSIVRQNWAIMGSMIEKHGLPDVHHRLYRA